MTQPSVPQHTQPNDFLLYLPCAAEELRGQAFTLRAAQFRRLHEQCRSYKSEVLPAEHPMRSITYFGMAAANLSLAYLLTGQQEYLTEARRWLRQGTAYPHWGRAVKVDVDLSASWLLFGFGLAYEWLGDSLPAPERRALGDKLILQGERMYEYIASHRGDCWVTNYWQNHNWIDHTGLAVAGYALMRDYPAAKRWTDAALADMSAVYPLLAPDGSDYEGIAYWRYGVIWLALYADVARQREGIDFFASCSFLRNTFFYRLYQCGPDLSQNFNFGDCHDTRSGHSAALYYKLAREYRIGEAQSLADLTLRTMLWREGYESGIKPGILPEAFLEFLWYDPTVQTKELSALPTARLFPDLGLYSRRTSWEPDAQAFSFKCASGGGHTQWRLAGQLEAQRGYAVRSMGHHHPDANSFILIRGTDYLVVDEGYSSAKRAADHNLVLADELGYEFDGQYDVYRGLSFDRTAELEAADVRPGFTLLCGESSRLYKKELALRLYRREVLCADKGYFIVCDTLKADRAHRYTSLLHFETMPAIEGRDCTVRTGLSRLLVHWAQDDVTLSARECTVSANPTSQEPSLILTHTSYALSAKTNAPADAAQLCCVLAAQGRAEIPVQCFDCTTQWGRVFLVRAPGWEEAAVLNTSGAPVCGTVSLGGRSFTVSAPERWSLHPLPARGE